jgi:hypothetical protein
MIQPVNSSTSLPRSHSPWLFSPFSIDCHGNYVLLDQILCNGLMLQQLWYDDSLPNMCQAACRKAFNQEAREQLTAAVMAELPYVTATSANNNNNTKENNTCAHQDDHGTLANPPSPSGGSTSGSQVCQRTTPQYATSQGGATSSGDIPCHPIWHPCRIGCLSNIIEEGVDKQAGVASLPPEVKGRDTIIIEPHYLYLWDNYSPYDHSEGDALFDEADPTMD